MAHVEKDEGNVVELCKDQSITQDMRRRAFVLLVIGRMTSNGLFFSDLQTLFDRTNVSADSFSRVTDGKKGSDRLFPHGAVKFISSHKYPRFALYLKPECLHVPSSPDFPGVDAILRVGSAVIAFVMHVGRHRDVKKLLLEHATDANWFDGRISTVILVYLSPHPSISEDQSASFEHATAIEETGRIKRRRQNEEYPCSFYTVFCATEHFPALKSISFLPDK